MTKKAAIRQERITQRVTPNDGIAIQSVMHFPINEYLRESWRVIKSVSDRLSVMEEDDRAELDKATITKLIDAPSYEQMTNKTISAIKKGVIAGDMLAIIYLMDRFKIPEPSLKKATHIAQQFAAVTRYGDSSRMNRSRRKIREAFKEYRTAAHLWAAYRINRAYPYAEQRELFSDKLNLFLEVSQGLLEFGQNFIPYRARPAEPILPAEGMWELPEGTVARHLHGGDFPDRIESLLGSYDADEYLY